MKKRTPEIAVAQPNRNGIPESLVYYDPELMNAWNAEPFDAKRVERAVSKSRKLREQYMKSLVRLRSRLGKRTYKRFTAERDSLFDSNLLEFTFGDDLGFDLHRNRPAFTVRAIFLSYDKDKLHNLRYRNVESLSANVPNERWCDVGRKKRIDSLLAHELTDAGEGLTKHQFLFASGATIVLTFGQISWDTHSAFRTSAK